MNPEPSAVTSASAREDPNRLLLISYEYPPLGGGLGKAVRQTALEFARLGYEVTILTSRFGDLLPEDEDGPLRIVRIPVLRRHANHARMIDVLSFGVSGVLLSRARLGRHRPAVILAYLTVPSGVVGAWLAWRESVPLLTLLRGTDVPGHTELEPWMHRLAGPLLRLIWRRSLHVVSNSESMARQTERAVPGLSVRTVHNGVDCERYAPPPAPVREDGPLRVLYTGRLVRVKRLESLLRTWGELHRTLDVPAVLELAGYGPERESLERLTRELGIESDVRFLGHLREEAMIKAYHSASVFLSWSRDEGLPNAVLEAMACGLPVVLSDIGPHREIVVDSGGGMLCDPDDPDALVSALAALLRDPQKRELMGERARRAMVERFSWERTARGLQDLFPRTVRIPD